MSAHNVLQELLLADYSMPDPGDAEDIVPDRSPCVVGLVSGASAETRTVPVPTKAGLVLWLGLMTDGGGDVTVTVTSGYNAAGATSLVFGDLNDYVKLESIETASGTFRWKLTAYEGVAVTDASRAMTAASATSLVVGSQSVASILATNISIATGLTAPNIVATSAMSLNSGLVTSMSAANLSVASKSVVGITTMVTGGTAVGTDATTIPAVPVVFLSVGTSSKNYFKLPAAANGLCQDVINLGSTAGLVGAAGSVCGATSTALATAGADNSAVALVCDGTNWWQRAI